MMRTGTGTRCSRSACGSFLAWRRVTVYCCCTLTYSTFTGYLDTDRNSDDEDEDAEDEDGEGGRTAAGAKGGLDKP